MARRRGTEPPYEIMRRKALEEGNLPAKLPTGDSSSSFWQTVRNLWPRADEPLVLHVPKGVAVAALVTAIVLMALSYWVGHQRGEAASARLYESQRASRDGLFGPRPRVAPDREGVGVAGAGPAPASPDRAADQASDPVDQPRAEADPRTPGLNYFVLVTCGRDEARGLIDFLGPFGVEAVAVTGNNPRLIRGGLVQIVATRGFRGEEWTSQSRDDFETKLRRIGREWKARNGGRGTDLSDMYGELYKGQ